jgi:hypothetical protein
VGLLGCLATSFAMLLLSRHEKRLSDRRDLDFDR